MWHYLPELLQTLQESLVLLVRPTAAVRDTAGGATVVHPGLGGAVQDRRLEGGWCLLVVVFRTADDAVVAAVAASRGSAGGVGMLVVVSSVHDF